MPFWPFKRKEPEPTTPLEVRAALIAAAASRSPSRLKTACAKFKSVVAANLDLMCKAPDDIRSDAAAMQNYIQCLGAVAQCLAEECGSPELWNTLTGTAESNPLIRWDKWYGELPQRVQRLEHKELIAEAQEFLAEARRLEGTGARQHEAFLQGRLGELLFNSGKVADAIPAFQTALDICRDIRDLEGERIHLNNLLEAHRYLGNKDQAIQFGEAAILFAEQHRLDCANVRKQVKFLRQGEPLCRIVLVRDGQDFELSELPHSTEGSFQFHFRRNRLSLQMTETLVRQGSELGTAGKQADALEKFQAAMDVDPYDPDPVYQSGDCLLDLGAYAQAAKCFEEVERLAPGWFRCRSDRWLAGELEKGDVSADEYQILRVLEDGGLSPDKAKPIALGGVAKFPEFAPLYLCLGDIYRNQGDEKQALACYRNGLQLVAEPDLESRLLCATAGLLPADSAERRELVERAKSLQGSLIAQAMAALIR